MAEKKVRIRKAATHQQAEAARVAESSKLSSFKASMPGPGISRFMRPILRPLRWLTPTYFVNSWREVRQVTWPNRRETWRLTLAVFIFAAVFGALIAGVDKGLDLLFKKIILKQ